MAREYDHLFKLLIIGDSGEFLFLYIILLCTFIHVVLMFTPLSSLLIQVEKPIIFIERTSLCLQNSLKLTISDFTFPVIMSASSKQRYIGCDSPKDTKTRATSTPNNTQRRVHSSVNEY